MKQTMIKAGLGAITLFLLTATFSPNQVEPKQAEYEIQGAFCSGCVGQLTKAAQQLEGVGEVKVDVEERIVYVTFDEEKVKAETIMEHINKETTFNLALNEVKDVETTSSAG